MHDSAFHFAPWQHGTRGGRCQSYPPCLRWPEEQDQAGYGAGPAAFGAAAYGPAQRRHDWAQAVRSGLESVSSALWNEDSRQILQLALMLYLAMKVQELNREIRRVAAAI